jgi:hypothetical protein
LDPQLYRLLGETRRVYVGVGMWLRCRDKKYIKNFGEETFWAASTWKAEEMGLRKISCEDGK